MIKTKRYFAICVNNADYEASLMLRKVYEIIPDEAATRDDLITSPSPQMLVIQAEY